MGEVQTHSSLGMWCGREDMSFGIGPTPTSVHFLLHHGQLASAVKTTIVMRLKPATADYSC